MATKTLTQIIGGADPLPKMAPDLTNFTDREGGAVLYILLTGIDTTGALTTLLSLTGKFAIDLLYLQSMTVNDMDQIKLTIDGVVIFNETSMSDNAGTEHVLGNIDLDHGHQYMCESSLLFEIEMNIDTSIDFAYLVRPIL